MELRPTRAVSPKVVMACMGLVTISMTLYESARVPLLEDAICRRDDNSTQPPIYPADVATSRDCTSDEIQTEVASLNGWMEFVAAMQALILSLPYAWLAKAVDKCLLLIIGFATTSLSMFLFYLICYFSDVFDTKLVPLSRIPECIGGGAAVSYILLYSLLADATPTEKRAAMFYKIGAVFLFARTGSMILCGVLLKSLPSAIGPANILFGTLAIPTLLLHLNTSHPKHKYEAVSTTELYGNSSVDNLPAESKPPSSSVSPRNEAPVLKHCKQTLVTAYTEYLTKEVFCLGFLICGIKIMGQDVQFIQAQWIVKRYHWSYSAATYINAYAALVCLLVLSGLPSISSFITKTVGNPRKMESLVMQVSMMLRIVGTLAMGLSPNRLLFLLSVGIQALSAGTYDTFKSFITSFTDSENSAELYAIITIVETLAHVLSSQFWPAVFVKSMNLDEFGMGLPFWLSAGFGVATLGLMRKITVYIQDVFEPAVRD